MKRTYGVATMAISASPSLDWFPLIITGDFGTAGPCLALALVFQPFNGKPYKEWAIWQKALIVSQLTISSTFVGMYLYATVTG